jgi:hypothetical protein
MVGMGPVQVDIRAGAWLEAVACLLLPCLFAGCVALPRGTGLSRPTRVAASIDRRAWLARVEIADPDVPGKALIEDSLTINVLEYLGEAGYFRTVNVLPGQVNAADYLLRLRFDRYRQQRAPHPAYFPGALLTLTLWIWFGGPIYTDTSDLAASLVVEDRRGRALTTLVAEKKERHSVSLWSPQICAAERHRGGTAIVEDLFERATNYLQQQKGGLS